jgi:hypothetical protein
MAVLRASAVQTALMETTTIITHSNRERRAAQDADNARGGTGVNACVGFGRQRAKTTKREPEAPAAACEPGAHDTEVRWPHDTEWSTSSDGARMKSAWKRRAQCSQASDEKAEFLHEGAGATRRAPPSQQATRRRNGPDVETRQALPFCVTRCATPSDAPRQAPPLARDPNQHAHTTAEEAGIGEAAIEAWRSRKSPRRRRTGSERGDASGSVRGIERRRADRGGSREAGGVGPRTNRRNPRPCNV